MVDPGEVRLRRAGAADAAALLALQLALDSQSRFMLLEPGERGTDDAPLRAALARRESGEDRSFTLLAEAAGDVVGYVDVTVSPFARARRTGYVVMGVHADWAGRGLGRRLLEGAAGEATRGGLRRLELTVMTHNLRAVRLYLSCGFTVEGLRREALVVDGGSVDEYYMARLLGETT